MKIIKLLGKKQFLINAEHITFVEETDNGCKIHFYAGQNIQTDATYEETCRKVIKVWSENAATFKDCGNCKHFSKGSKDAPCAFCEAVNGIPDQWEAQP